MPWREPKSYSVSQAKQSKAQTLCDVHNLEHSFRCLIQVFINKEETTNLKNFFQEKKVYIIFKSSAIAMREQIESFTPNY